MENNNSHQSNFQELSAKAMKENLMYSMMSVLWGKCLSDIPNKKEVSKSFFSTWKKNMHQLTQKQLGLLNNGLNESNADLLNIIAGNESGIIDVENYQEMINNNFKEVEQIFLKITSDDEEDNLGGDNAYLKK